MNFDCRLTVLLMEAGASVDHGAGVKTTGEHVKTSADRGCCVSSCSLLSSFEVDVMEDEAGQYAIHPVTGERISRTEGQDRHTLALRPLPAREESECNPPTSDPAECGECSPRPSESPAKS
jgi:hypothetical protein